MWPKKWEKSFIIGVVIPAKLRFCNDGNDKVICDSCDNQVKENKKIEAMLSLLKRQHLNQFGRSPIMNINMIFCVICTLCIRIFNFEKKQL